MEEKCVEKYEMSGTFFSTNKIYFIPYPREQDWHPYPEMIDSDNDWSDSDDPDDAQDAADGEVAAEIGLAPAPAVDPAIEADIPLIGPTPEQKALIAKMHECAAEARRKEIKDQDLNSTKM